MYADVSVEVSNAGRFPQVFGILCLLPEKKQVQQLRKLAQRG
jgi:hypothetical protein